MSLKVTMSTSPGSFGDGTNMRPGTVAINIEVDPRFGYVLELLFKADLDALGKRLKGAVDKEAELINDFLTSNVEKLSTPWQGNEGKRKQVRQKRGTGEKKGKETVVPPLE